jgi:hypothetical protein
MFLAFSGVSAAVEYTFPLLLRTREQFFAKPKCRAVVTENVRGAAYRVQ